jgi:hypothetical protein
MWKKHLTKYNSPMMENKKPSQQISTERMCLSTIKDKHSNKKLTSYSMVNTEIFLLRSGIRVGKLLSSSIQHSTGSPNQRTYEEREREERERKRQRESNLLLNLKKKKANYLSSQVAW